MALIEILMPKMGESVMEATIIGWLKNVGDAIGQDESLLEVATDKVDTEVPSTHGGILKELLAKEGDVVKVGSPVAIIVTDGDESTTQVSHNGKEQAVMVEEPVQSPMEEKGLVNETTSENSNFTLSVQHEGRFYSPLVKNIAKEEHISMQELDTIPGTGKEGRVTKNDILAYLQNRKANVAQKAIAPNVVPASTISGDTLVKTVSVGAHDEIIEMDRMRKIIAHRMVESKHISAHVQSFVEADLTDIVKWRDKVKDEFFLKHSEKLTFTPIFLEAVVKALVDYPMLNISVSGDKIIKKKNINVGMAVALQDGNLIVPVIKNADQLSLVGLAKKVNDLASRARNNKLTPDDLSDGTYTVSNVGSFGSLMGTPIILQPQVGILALGAIIKKPAVLETEYGDVIAIRHKMIMSHSYDHRVIDGALGGMFVKRVADYLEQFDTNRQI